MRLSLSPPLRCLCRCRVSLCLSDSQTKARKLISHKPPVSNFSLHFASSPTPVSNFSSPPGGDGGAVGGNFQKPPSRYAICSSNMETLEETTETLNPPGSETVDPKTLADTQTPPAMPQKLGIGLASGPGSEVESLAVGDFVWGKIKSHQWWPGRVFDPLDASDHARKAPRKDQSSVLVAYFGDDRFAWCNPSQLKPFFENFEQMASSGGSKSFRAALDSAVSEIGKILEAELSCNCWPEEERSGIEKYLGKSGEVNNFSAEEFLGLLKDVVVDVSVVNVLKTAKLRSWLVAFQRGLNVGHKRKVIADLVDKIDLDVPAVETVEGPEVLNGPEVLSEKSNRGRKKRSMAALIAQTDLDSVEVSDDDDDEESGKDLEVENGNAGGDVKEEEVGSGRRERKKSKYLSPPYTYLRGGFAKSLVSPKSSETKTLKSPRGLSFGSSAAVVKCSIEGSYKEEEEKNTPLFQVDGVDVREVLSEFLVTAANPLHLKLNRSAKVVRGFFAEFRSSVFSSGAKFDAYQKQVSESSGAEIKFENKEVGDKSEEGKQTERKRGRKQKYVVNSDAETPIDKSEEGKKIQGKKGRKRKDMVNGDGETPINKSEEGKKSEGKRGRKRRDKVNGQGEAPMDLRHQTSQHSENKDEAALEMNTMEEGANRKAPVTPKHQKATGLENGTLGHKRGRKKADATQNITVNFGRETVNNVGVGKSGQEQTKGEEVTNTSPTELDIECHSQMKEAIMGQKRKNSKNRPIVDVPVNLGGNGSGEGKSRQKKKKNKNSTSNEDPAGVLLTFSTDIILPSKEDLISAFSKYGPVIQSETKVVKESSSAKVVFGRSSDAEKAFNDKVAALGLPVANYRLRYLTGNLSSPSSATPIPVPKPPLPYIRKSLERMISTLSGSALEKVVGTSEALKPETRDNLVGEMQGLLMKVDKMLTGPAAGTSS